LGRFQQGDLRYLCNVNVLTTGFDAPHIDCVALVRPTMSPGLFSQMCGRGFRLHEGKENCLVLDFGGNVLRHGPVDAIRVTSATRGTGAAPAKECPACQAVIAAGFARCPQCDYEFPPPQRQQHDAVASEAGILSGQVTTTKYRVLDVHYSVHTKRGAGDDAPRSLRVDYQVDAQEHKSEWICLEHDGYARLKAVGWWRRHSPDPVPDTAERAIEIIEGGGLAATLSITVRCVAGEPHETILDHELGPLPEPLPAGAIDSCDFSRTPF
jgi:DNA repair protein RadD